MSVVRSCAVAGFSRSGWYKRSTAKDQTALRLRIRDLAHTRPRFGYNRIWVLLRREGWPVNRKRVRRLYRLEGLQVRMRVRRRKHMALHRGPAPVPGGPQERWSMDFVHDQLAEGQPFRVLTVVDQWSRQSPVLEAAQRFSGSDVALVLDRVIGGRPAAPLDHGGPWDRVHVPRARGLGLPSGHPTRLHPAGQASGERTHRVVQRSPAGRVPERAAVLFSGRCQGEDRSVAS